MNDLGVDKSICRTCLSQNENMENIYNIAEVLMICTSVQVQIGDGLPSTICTDCLNKLNQAYEFRLLSTNSDKTLRSQLINKNIILIKEERSDSDFYQNNEFMSDFSAIDDEDLNVSKRIQRKTTKKVRKKETIEEKNKVSAQKIDIDHSSSDGNISANTEKNKNSNELSCQYCDMKFRYEIRLKKHEYKHITGLKCNICSKNFQTIKQLNNHINIHSRKGAHLCQICGKQFTLPENLLRHQRIHNGIRPYKCEFCNKSFTQSNELKSHLLTHSREKHHLCSICGNKYSRSVSLRIHMRRIHLIPPNHRPFVCTICSRDFKDRRDLSQHMTIHTGERSHICKFCGKAFNRSSNLRVHERIHTGHKPYVCSVCQRAFVQKHVLITHMRTHPEYMENEQQIDSKTS